MNKKFFLVIFIQILLSVYIFSAEVPKGTELCDSVYSYFINHKVQTEKLAIVNSNENYFPYNIYIDIPARIENNTQTNTLLLTFFMEDIVNHYEIILEAINYTKKQHYNFNVKFLFVYGDNSKFQKHGSISGSESFINSLSFTDNITSIIFNFHSGNNRLIVSSRTQLSPSWLVQNEANIFLKNGIYSNLSLYVVSQIYRYSFLIDSHLDSYFSKDIPCIKLNLNPQQVSNQIIRSVIEDSINSFSETDDLTWDKHYILVDFLKKYYVVSETLIVKIIIVIFFVFSIFIFVLFFITSINKFNSFTIIRRIWYTLPVTLVLTIIIFFLTKIGFNTFGKKLSEAGKIYTLIGSQLSFSFTITAFYYYFINITVTNFEERSIDYLIILSTLFNQFFFLLIDISLFPIFLLIFFFSIFCLKAKNKYFHVIFFIFSIIIFIPYLHRIIASPAINDLRSYLLLNNRVIFIFSLILCPVFLTFFRIITSFKYTFGNRINLVLLTSGASIFIILVCTTVGILRTKQINKSLTKEPVVFIKGSKDNTINVTYNDKKIFTDLIRTIDISFSQIPEQCDVRIISEKGNPILYSENSFEPLNDSTSFFNIPDCPPKDLKFSYGTNNIPCTIVITALYESNIEDQYIMDRKSIKIE